MSSDSKFIRNIMENIEKTTNSKSQQNSKTKLKESKKDKPTTANTKNILNKLEKVRLGESTRKRDVQRVVAEAQKEIKRLKEELTELNFSEVAGELIEYFGDGSRVNLDDIKSHLRKKGISSTNIAELIDQMEAMGAMKEIEPGVVQLDHV